jgi:hypothetical protein
MSDSVVNLPRCQGETAVGAPCERIVRPSERYCYSHNPARATERASNASKAAKSKVGTELREIKAQLKTLADDVLSGRVTPGKASVASQVLGTYLRVVEAERKHVEVEMLKEEVAEVKAMYESQQRRYR